ncbi:MAG: hypothetical protein A3F72_13320 [Bacteroidetes bacterium RIFCSPLOWO2_12_FULL_35_15]|nr:MAG: hypothetical protein A3F72_13320 [Bacteroidetes bacterium RIFCSPLOWO2_12_FULL_35_15]
MSKDCCKNKVEIFKIKSDYIPKANIGSPSSELISVALMPIQLLALPVSERPVITPNLNYLYPPDKPLSLSILYRSILI